MLNTKNKKYADDYIKALEDTINNRHGMCDAIDYVMHIDKGGYGLNDEIYAGFTAFLDGNCNLAERTWLSLNWADKFFRTK